MGLIFFFNVSVWWYGLMRVSPRGDQSHRTGPLELELQSLAASCGCWEPNSDPLEEQLALLSLGQHEHGMTDIGHL